MDPLMFVQYADVSATFFRVCKVDGEKNNLDECSINANLNNNI